MIRGSETYFGTRGSSATGRRPGRVRIIGDSPDSRKRAALLNAERASLASIAQPIGGALSVHTRNGVKQVVSQWVESGHSATGAEFFRSACIEGLVEAAPRNECKSSSGDGVMTKYLAFMCAAAFAFGTPAPAKPDQARGNHGKGHAAQSHGKSSAKAADTGGRLLALDKRGNCPPGLAKKGNGCLPPGRAKKMYNVGQRYNRNFGNLWSYNQIPLELRNQYSFDPSDRYYYNQGYVYQVDPKTLLIQQVVSALLR